MELSFFSERFNILIIFIIVILIYFYCRKPQNKAEIISNIFISFIMISIFGYVLYLKNFDSETSAIDVDTLSNLSVNINTFKEHEDRLPKEKDFYLSGFLNDSQYFKIKDGKKVFNPIFNSNFKLIDNVLSLSLNYTKIYDETSFIERGEAYRSCLNFPIRLNKDNNFNFQQIKVSINGKDFDYKKATIDSMKNICYLGKPNNYQITFF